MLLQKVADQYEQRNQKQRERVQRLSPAQLLEFSVACETQQALELELASKGADIVIHEPCATQWRWLLRQQRPCMLMLALTSQPLLTHAWVVTYQSRDTIELQTVERYSETMPRLHLQDHDKWYVSYNACCPPGLVLRRYQCPSVKGKQTVQLYHESPWLVHSCDADLIILHTVTWFRQKQERIPLIGAHRVMALTPPNTPRAF